jgi:tetratricopeptide (TPR) repeat protein
VRTDPEPKREQPTRPPEPDTPGRPEARTQAPPLVVDLSSSKRTTEPDERKTTSANNTPPPVEIELTAKPRSLPEARQPTPPPQLPPTVTTDVGARRLPPTVTEPDSKPPPAKQVINDQAPAPADPDAVVKLLSAFIYTWSRNLVLPPVAPILEGLGEQSIATRQKLEIEALRATGTLFEKGLFDRNTPQARRKVARSLIVGLDDDYAWSNNDRRLYTMMPQATADQFVRLLRAARDDNEMALKPTPAPRRRRNAGKSARWGLGLIGFALYTLIRVLTWGLPHSQPAVIRPLPNYSYTPTFQPPPNPYTSPSSQPPNYAVSVFSQGAEYDNKGQVDRAIQEYDLAISLNPGYAAAYYNRGLDYANKGELDRAIQDYDQAVRLNHGNPDYFISRGAAHDAKGQYDEAIQDYDQAIQLKPGYVLALVNRGIAYANKEQYDRAIQDYDQALRLAPNDADALYNRGQAKQARGDAAGGDADIARAGQLNPSLLPASPQAQAGEQAPSPNSGSPSAAKVKPAK